MTANEDRRNKEPKVPIYRHRKFQQGRQIRADKERRSGINKGVNGGCFKSSKINGQDEAHL